MKKLIITLLIFKTIFFISNAQHVTITGNRFQVEGRDIFFSGINAPWQIQSDCDINFLRRNFDWNWWDNEFRNYAANNINLVRIWIHGSGNFSPAINSNSFIDPYPANDLFWQNMDALVNLAATYQVYIMPTFWSFDMVKQGMSTHFTRYRTLIQDDNRIGSYINNFLIPFVQRYNSNPWIMGYDLCNEPEHMWRDPNCGNINQYWVMRFFARCAAAVNQHTTKPVTVGPMWIIYNSSRFGAPDGDPNSGWNRWSNASLRSYYDSPFSYLDFYSPHWYQWQNTSGPYERNVGNWLDVDDKPVIIGETYGGNLPNIYGTLANYYIQAYQRGYDGVLGWKNACQNDGFGTFAGVAQATNGFFNAYPHLVFPLRRGVNCNVQSIPNTIQAENFCNMSGVQTENTLDTGGGQSLGWIDGGDWFSYRVNVPSSGTYQVQYRVASLSGGGTIRLERGGGSIVFGSISVPATGGWQSWQTISHTVNLPAGEQDLAIVAQTGGWNINWIRITGPSGTTNIAFNKPAFASSVESSTFAASRAFDANGTTRWASAWTNEQWIYVDLQGQYSINRVRLDWEAAFARQFQIQVSNDNVNWTTVFSNYNGTGGTTDVSLSTQGRYVKMYAWQRATQWGYSLREFEVYGSLSAPIMSRSSVASTELRVFPNPASDELTIHHPGLTCNVVIINMAGSIVEQISPKGSQSTQLNVSAWIPGVYLVRAGQQVQKLLVR